MLDIFGKWKDKVADYVDARIKLMKLAMVEQISGVMSYLIYILIMLFVLLAVFILIGIGLGEYMAEVVDSRSGGFFIASGIFVFFIFLFVALRKYILRLFSGLFIGVLTAGHDDDEDDEERHDNH
jgi:hypothetical protein